MNSKTAILAVALGLGLASSASAQTVIRITGSTAFRSSVYNAIQAVLSNETIAFVGSANGLNSSGQANFTGTFNGQPVIVQTAWSGSAAGIQTVAGGLPVTFLKGNTAGSVAPGTNYATAPATDSGVPDMAMSDVFQTSTTFTSPQLVDNQVCVVPFVFMANKGAPAELTNVTPGLIQNLYQGGHLPLALFTGVAADHTPTSRAVYGLGRDPESGTRITAMAESGTGAFANVLQYSVTVSSTDGSLSNPVPFPKGSSNFSNGNNGYSSGGTLAGVLAAPSANSNVYLGYLGVVDAATANASGAGAKYLSWNGVPYSKTAVTEGQYSFWGYEHLFHKDSLTGVPMDLATALISQINANPGNAGISLSDMHVSRVSDGAPIGNDY